MPTLLPESGGNQGGDGGTETLLREDADGKAVFNRSDQSSVFE